MRATFLLMLLVLPLGLGCVQSARKEAFRPAGIVKAASSPSPPSAERPGEDLLPTAHEAAQPEQAGVEMLVENGPT